MVQDRINSVYVRHMFNSITPSNIRRLYQDLKKELDSLKTSRLISEYTLNWSESKQLMEVKYTEMAKIQKKLDIKLSII